MRISSKLLQQPVQKETMEVMELNYNQHRTFHQWRQKVNGNQSYLLFQSHQFSC